MNNSKEAIAVSENMQSITNNIEKELKKIKPEGIGFSLFVWTEGRCNYIANTTDRVAIKEAINSVITGWNKGMPDIPAHEVKG